MTERIDAHHHFWRYNPAEYDWIDERMSALKRDFMPAELTPLLEAEGIAGTIAVQARQSMEETAWLLSLAAEAGFIRGVVGWAPIAASDFEARLEVLRMNPVLKGLRHVIQAESDDNYILSDAFNQGIAALLPTGLVYEILIHERQVPQAIGFVDRHPNQIFVLDHLAKPAIAEQRSETWRGNIARLAERENVYCKLSGMVTEASWQAWREDDLLPYWENVLAAFGPRRLIFGSDWPVCLLASSYQRWFEVVRGWIKGLTSDEQDCILGGTATEVYRLR